MYKIQFELTVTLIPSNPSAPHPFTNPMQMQHPLEPLPSYTTVWSEDYYGGFPFDAGPVYQGTALNRQIPYTGPVYPMAPNQQPHNQYQPPTSGPSLKQRRKEARKAVHPYANHVTMNRQVQSPMDRSTGSNPGMARNDASNNTGIGKVWKTPSKNPFVTDCNST